jgi:hypothetical protein
LAVNPSSSPSSLSQASVILREISFASADRFADVGIRLESPNLARVIHPGSIMTMFSACVNDLFNKVGKPRKIRISTWRL